MSKMDLGNTPPWLVQFVYRLLMLRAPGVYEFILIIEDDGRRRLVIKNPSQPHQVERLGG